MLGVIMFPLFSPHICPSHTLHSVVMVGNGSNRTSFIENLGIPPAFPSSLFVQFHLLLYLSHESSYIHKLNIMKVK
jgi:hypothetical protein